MRLNWGKVIPWCIMGILVILVIYFLEAEEFDFVRALEDEDSYLIHREELIPREEVTSFIAADGKLMLHYADTELVNVYSSAGKFLFGIQISDGSNGSTGIAYRDGLLYIKGRLSGIYVFAQDKLVQFEEQGIRNAQYDVLDDLFPSETCHTDEGYTYFYVAEGNKIIRTDVNETVDFLVLPQKNPNINVILCAIVVLISGIGFFDEKKKARSNEL